MKRQNTIIDATIGLLLSVFAGFGGGFAIAEDPPSSTPEAKPSGTPAEPARAEDARVDEILSKLESRSNGLRDIRCRVVFVEDDRVNLTKHKKTGTILFQITEPNPRFLVHFERTEVEGILGKQEWFLFDGQWLLEANERLAQVTRRQIVEPGGKVELFDLEKAPFPLPFGQKKESILRHFDVKLQQPEPDDPGNTDHLVCTSKPDGVMRDRYDRLEFFIGRDLHLPLRIVAIRSNGHETHTADFPDLSERSINTGVAAEAFAPPSTWKTFKEVVEPLKPASP